MRTKTLWLWLGLLVTSLALVAAGCGGDDNEAAATGATTANVILPALCRPVFARREAAPSYRHPLLAAAHRYSAAVLLRRGIFTSE